MTEVKARHILVENEEHANQIKLSIERDEMSFEEAAKEKSEGPSGSDGGDLGWFGRGDMVKPFEREVFDMEVGEISDPVETKFGWHLIRKDDER